MIGYKLADQTWALVRETVARVFEAGLKKYPDIEPWPPDRDDREDIQHAMAHLDHFLHGNERNGDGEGNVAHALTRLLLVVARRNKNNA